MGDLYGAGLIPLNALLDPTRLPTIAGSPLARAGLRSTGMLPTLARVPTVISDAWEGRKWVAVKWRFTALHEAIQLTRKQREDATTKVEDVARCLRTAYWGETSTLVVVWYIGSWAKNTMVRPPSDVDLHFVIPYDTYARIENRTGNKQSALLQEIKTVLESRYRKTEMRADGQVVIVDFDSYKVEVAPIIAWDGRWICDTNNGGSYRQVFPQAEVDYIEAVDHATSRNLRPLIRMLKTWKRMCNVPIKSFHLELVAAEFLSQSPWRHKDFFYFDWITRDFFAYLYHRANGYVVAPGNIADIMALGDEWRSKALTAYQRAAKACDYEQDNLILAAGSEWQKIFGTDAPLYW